MMKDYHFQQMEKRGNLLEVKALTVTDYPIKAPSVAPILDRKQSMQ